MEAFFCISLIVDVSLFVLRSACCVFMKLSLLTFESKKTMILFFELCSLVFIIT